MINQSISMVMLSPPLQGGVWISPTTHPRTSGSKRMDDVSLFYLIPSGMWM